LFPFSLDSGPILANDGGFYSPTYRLKADKSGWDFEHYSRWKLSSSGQPITETSASSSLRYSRGISLQWGFDPARTNGAITAGGSIVGAGTVPVLPFMPTNVIVQPGGSILAMPSAQSDEKSQVFIGGAWKPGGIYGQAIDIADDGTAIGKSHDDLIAPICINGKWTGIERAIANPGISNNWQDTTFSLVDTTPSGWILAKKSITSLPDQHEVLVPFRVEGFYDTSRINEDDPAHPEGVEVSVDYTSGMGVDDFSIGSTDPGDAVDDHIWIMAPTEEGATFATFKAPLNINTPLKLKTVGEDLNFGSNKETTLDSPSEQVAISGEVSISGLAVPIEMYFGDTKSESRPVSTKLMRTRTVNVRVYKIAKETGNTLSPDLVPSELAIKKHLENLFKPQINVCFNVHLVPEEIEVAWSGLLESANPDLHSPDQSTIMAELPADPPETTANIRVLLIGSNSRLDSGGTSLGLTNRQARTCWVLARSGVGYRKKQDVLDSIGHEVGHVFVGYGHPSESIKGDHGRAPLPGTEHHLRLMTKGNNSSTESRILVKGEWDEAETWLKNEEDNGRLPQ
jgi:hypothetical protein